ncbi:hypothetical protein WICMUC_005458 [Wickerhamomyces mucosus]|uniref:RING-type domain-containing protein n=1 Tax=Wickerhamomyces mucosus TaxID=1378264 RepID=A0A9P8T5T4_9ASCO|nr:hypothetical protein WICMUC_005458 [Wickerhamomyces mucosus]
MESIKTIEFALLEAVNQTVCPICTDHMFVPVMTKCGHNFCYECITNWLVSSNQGGTSCPSCRTDITEPPYLNLQIQGICNTLLETMGNLNDSKVPTELIKDRDEKIREYKRDLKRKRLYKNVFKSTGQAVVDQSDGVARCSHCHWEVHGNYCSNCNIRLRNPHDIPEEDVSDEADIIRFALNHDEASDSEEDLDLRTNSDDDGFIDDRDIHEIETMDEDPYLSDSSSPARLRTRYIPTFEDSDDADANEDYDEEEILHTHRRTIGIESDESNAEADDSALHFEEWNGFGPASSSSSSAAFSESFFDAHATRYHSDEDEDEDEDNLRRITRRGNSYIIDDEDDDD